MGIDAFRFKRHTACSFGDAPVRPGPTAVALRWAVTKRQARHSSQSAVLHRRLAEPCSLRLAAGLDMKNNMMATQFNVIILGKARYNLRHVIQE